MIAVAIKTRITTSLDDQRVLELVQEYLDKDFITKYEVTSITSLDGKTTTIIVNTGYVDIAIEADNRTGKILSKEKLVM